MHVLLVGYGNMGAALRASWRALDGVRVTVVSPEMPHDGELNDPWISSVTDLESSPDIVVFAVKPHVLTGILPEYRGVLSSALGISIAAGITLDSLKTLSGAASFVRVMPNLPVRAGLGVCALQSDAMLSKIDRHQVETLIGAASTFIWCETDDQMDVFTAVFGSGSGFIFDIIMQYTQAARNVGMSSDDLVVLVRQLFQGTIALLAEKTVEELCDEVTSPGGTTQAGLESMRSDDSLRTTFEKAFTHAIARARELRPS